MLVVVVMERGQASQYEYEGEGRGRKQQTIRSCTVPYRNTRFAGLQKSTSGLQGRPFVQDGDGGIRVRIVGPGVGRGELAGG